MKDNFDDNIWNKLIPDVKTDHGKLNLADLVIIVVDLILLGYTGYRSWHFLDGSFSGAGQAQEYAVLAAIGLVGLDVGFVAWSLVWMFGSSTRWQDACAVVMLIIDMIGMALTSMVDSLTGSDARVPLLLATAALYGVPFIIILNVVVGVIYHMVSPQTALQRRTRRLEAGMEEKQKLAELQRRENDLKLQAADTLLKQRAMILEQQKRMAQQKLELDALEQGVARALSDDEAVRARSDQVKDEIRGKPEPTTPPVESPKPAYIKPPPEEELVPDDFTPAQRDAIAKLIARQNRALKEGGVQMDGPNGNGNHANTEPPKS